MRDDQPSFQVNLDVEMGRDPHSRDESSSVADTIFRIAICGDFTGRSGAAGLSSGAPAAWRVDRDDFDDVLASISPSLCIVLGSGMVVDVQIRDLDDFHPDQLFDRVPQFARLRELRTRLADPSSFRRAAAELSAPPKAPAGPMTRPTGSLLDTIIGEEAPVPHGSPARDDLYAFIQRAMEPHLVVNADPRQAELVAQVDESIATLMRALLHHPAFQALESLWRGVFRLVRMVETDERLQIHLIDVTPEALQADLLGAETAWETGLYKRLAERAPPEHGGWGVLVANQSFGGEAGDIATLERLADVGVALDAPWLAEAHPGLAMGSTSSEPALASWRRLRSSPAGRYLGLAIPRLLLRVPYGSADAIERFSFEELENVDAHTSYLWGNPALFCAALLGQGFTERGKGLAVGVSSEIGGLPLHMVRSDGESTAKPCAEVLMGESDAIGLLDAGFIPMLSNPGQDVVRVPRVQSIAEPAARLAGRMAG